MVFGVAKLLDLSGDLAALESSANPFAIVVLAHWQTLQTRHEPDIRQQWKLRLVKGLYRGNWSKEDVRQLFRLIDWMMALPQELEQAFRHEIFEYEKENNMPWLSSIERSGYEKGLKEGIEHGIEQGIEQGIERGVAQGIERGLLEGIAAGLEAKFGKAARKLLPKVRALASAVELRRFARFLKTTTTVAQVRSYFKEPS